MCHYSPCMAAIQLKGGEDRKNMVKEEQHNYLCQKKERGQIFN